MRNYQTPEAVEIGQASEAILGFKDAPFGDSVQNPDLPHTTSSIVDVDE